MSKMAPESSYIKYIWGALGLLVADGIISLAFVSSMVAFLHTTGGGPFEVAYPAGSTFELRGEPVNLLTNQGHTTNGAGGTAVVLIGFGGLIALVLESRSRKQHGKSSPWFYAWAVMTFLSWLLTLVALIYTFVVTSQTSGQPIDLAVARANPYPAKYALDSWTPENWYKAMLALPLVRDVDRTAIETNLNVQRGWRWNLIPLFLLGFVLVDLVALEIWRIRKSRGLYGRTPSGDAFPEAK